MCSRRAVLHLRIHLITAMTGRHPAVRLVALGNGAAGAEKQALALAHRLQHVLQRGHNVPCSVAFVPAPLTHRVARRLPPTLHVAAARVLRSPWFGYDCAVPSLLAADAPSETAPRVDVAIGCGRTTVALCAAWKLTAPARVYNIQIQHPRTPLHWFDAVVTPRHDFAAGRFLGPSTVPRNVHLTFGTVFDVTTELLEREAAAYERNALGTALPRAKTVLALLIGGPCRGFPFSRADAETMMDDFHGRLKATGNYDDMALVATFSRRTPTDVKSVIATQLRANWRPDRLFLWDGNGANPYYAMLAGADAIVITPDSVSMTTEAIASGKAVFTLGTDRCTGKFRNFHDTLTTNHLAHSWTDNFSTSMHMPQQRGKVLLDKELQQVPGTDWVVAQATGALESTNSATAPNATTTMAPAMSRTFSDGFEMLTKAKQLPLPSSVHPSVARLPWGQGKASWVGYDAAAAHTNQPYPATAMPRELQKLTATSYAIFMQLARLDEEKKRTERELGDLEIVKASRHYREALRTAIFGLEDRLASSSSSSDSDDELVDLLKVSLAVWHLCEVLFLQRRPRDDKRIAYDLAQWLQEHYASVRLDELEQTSVRMRSLTKPELDAAFWPTLYALVMMGAGRHAWALLASHSAHQGAFARGVASLSTASTHSTFQSIQRLLLCMPGSNSGAGVSQEWSQWHNACMYLLNADTFVKADANLTTLLEIMSAKDDTLKRQSKTWYELMMARLFLEEPKRVAHRLEFLMGNCWRVFQSGDHDQMSNFDCIILAILQYDVQSAMKDISAMNCSWMTAHLTDLLVKSHTVADDHVPAIGCTLREHFFISYAAELALNSGMWQFSVGYFERCPVFGMIGVRATLEREPVASDDKTHRLLAYCRSKKGLGALQQRITARRGRACQTQGRHAAALHWLLRGSHLDDVDALCDLVLEECSNVGSQTPLNEAVEFLETHPELARTQKLLWLVQYRELYLVLEDVESLRRQLKETNATHRTQLTEVSDNLRFVSQEAAKRVFQLINSTAAPSHLRGVLLREAEKLLLLEPTVFTSRQLYALMGYLHDLDRSFDKSAFYESSENQALKHKIETLISRNLCEALLAEAAGAPAAAGASSGPTSDLLTSSSQALAWISAGDEPVEE
ncbi:TPA: hypothetical protein N0F65_008192 [Lagenidium giganteum]|uniref:Nuclear pore complex protein Nup85 n=1 Tax=Lagenidium giganteum TaxID=4803 RepID=A0AAV2YK37_9STRA|nr:TPA: hypothetical protein N0F65_008192 [Lagenidium giganteum]